ncbi:hypothetical protein NMG60_11023915 [Bertholletia excelsa]
MAAKLLRSLTDDNPDLQKQIGCMTGIFQIFDHQHILTSKQISSHHPKGLPSGSSHFNTAAYETESANSYHWQIAKERASKKYANDKQKVSKESPRASFSSSSRTSSFSSLDCNRTAQPEPLSFDGMIFPEIPSRDPTSQSSASPQFGRHSLDLRDVVKDSMYREAWGLSVKTTAKEEAVDHVGKYKDSQGTNSVDGSSSMRINGKETLPTDLKESLRLLAKFREAPWYFNEEGEHSRTSHEMKDVSFYSLPKDLPRFSYDGREPNCMFFESQDTYKSTTKVKDLPRLSLDSRGVSVQSFNSDSKSNSPFRSSERDGIISSTRPPSVVAKLMGLETLPDAILAGDNQAGSTKNCSVEDSDTLSRTLKSVDSCQSVRTSSSSRYLWKQPISPCFQNRESVRKSISSSKFPIEPAPWKHLDGNRNSNKPDNRNVKTPPKATNSFSSVYSEVEKRLKDLKFNKSGKDLRALKQILEAMQAKGLLETKQGEDDSNIEIQRDQDLRSMNPCPSARLINQQKPHSDQVNASTNKAVNSSRTYESPIVIMKPAKLVEKSGIPASSVITMDRLSGLPKFRGSEYTVSRKSSFNCQTSKEQNPKIDFRENAVSSGDNKKMKNRMLKSAQTSTSSQHLPKENNISSLKSSGSTSPRLHQKRLELDKRTRPPISPDSSKSKRQPNKQQAESSSPGVRHRLRSSQKQQGDDQSSETSTGTRNSSYLDDDIYMESSGNIIMDSGNEVEVTSSEFCAETNGIQSPSMKAARSAVSGLMQKKLYSSLGEDGGLVEFSSSGPEHPSPVSVLDDTMYRDYALSPVRWMSDICKDDRTMNSNDNSSQEQCNSSENLMSNHFGSGIKSEINRKKLENIEHLVQKLRRLNSTHDEAHTDYIASLCENANPDHRYISEILLASGLLLRDLNASLTAFQLHPSGHPINPELFLVLEQTKASTLQKEESGAGKVTHMKPNKEKFHRKLIFDAVNEIVGEKLTLVGKLPEPWLRPDKLARKSLNAQKLLRELCSEIEQLQANKSYSSLEDEGGDSLKSMLWEDVMQRSASWTNFRGEISGMVLDVERLIFKDLVDEIVHGDSAGSRTKSSRRFRQLFA